MVVAGDGRAERHARSLSSPRMWRPAALLLAFLLFRNSGSRYALLSETMIALTVIFASLTIPLALEGSWTSAAWAIEAAGVPQIRHGRSRILVGSRRRSSG